MGPQLLWPASGLRARPGQASVRVAISHKKNVGGPERHGCRARCLGIIKAPTRLAPILKSVTQMVPAVAIAADVVPAAIATSEELELVFWLSRGGSDSDSDNSNDFHRGEVVVTLVVAMTVMDYCCLIAIDYCRS